MRFSLLALALVVPAALHAQYPAAGKYTLQASPVGTTQQFPLFLEVRQIGDSTALTFGQPAQDSVQVIPLARQGVVSGGFFFEFGALRCPFVKIEDHWEAVCSNQWDTPQFLLNLPGKADPPTP
jgi:hypothetical protein